MGTAGGMFAAYTYFATGSARPEHPRPASSPRESTYVYDRTGEVLLARFECQNREAVEFGELPDVVWEATVASEDRTFWENNGVDFQAIVRAALANLEAGEIVQGASTITQQVIDYARVLQEEGESTQVDPRRQPRRRASMPPDPDDPATEGNDPEEQADVCQPPAPTQSTRLRGQDPREHPGHAGHRGLPRPRGQGADPRDLPEPHLLRQRLVRDQGRGGELLRHHRPRAS